MSIRLFALTILTCGLSAVAANAACVSNGTKEPLLFTINSKYGDARIARIVESGADLCLPGIASAVFRVYASPAEIEGCSRIAGPDGRDTLVVFHRYDNCRWASHGE